MAEPEIIRKVWGTHEVALVKGGVSIRKIGEDWPKQILLYENLLALVEMKEEAFKKCGTDFEKGEKIWRKEVIKRIQGRAK